LKRLSQATHANAQVGDAILDVVMVPRIIDGLIFNHGGSSAANASAEDLYL
jgi:hypothetical protein